MPTPVAILLILAAAAAAGTGRHLQGGAGRRWLAMLLYAVALLPAIPLLAPAGWGHALAAVALAALLYLHLTWREYCGAEEPWWVPLLRYGAAYLGLAAVTGCWPVLLAAVLVWAACRWATRPSRFTADPHAAWEWVHGAAAGICWSAALLSLL